MFRKYSVSLSEKSYQMIQRYALTVNASVDQAVSYAVNEWMASTGNRIVHAQETRERMMAGKLRLKVVYRNSCRPGAASAASSKS
jgi:hypothetical protein